MIESEVLKDIPGVRHGFFTREGGHSSGLYASLNCGFGSGDDKAVVQCNREAVAGRLNIDVKRLLTVFQSHSPNVLVVEEPWDIGRPPKADAMVTAKPGIAIGVLTADCTPVLFADRDRRAVGAVHAGWKGALAGVIEATVGALERLGSGPQDLHAAIGPTICQANYEVGPEFFDLFIADEPANAHFFTASDRPGHYRFDLPALVRTRLERLGLAAVEDLRLCTYEDESRFFSYRRATHRGEPVYGRQISAILLEGR
jgi:YfiH family protein